MYNISLKDNNKKNSYTNLENDEEFDNKEISLQINDEENQVESSICRFCLESDNKEDLIVPCRCSGSMKFVHRYCLQEWRSQDVNSNNFKRCNQCLFEYELIDKTSNTEKCCLSFCSFFESNKFIIFIFLQIFLILLSLFYKSIDADGTYLYKLFGIHVQKSREYYIFSVITLLCPLTIVIITHDMYIYHKYKLNTYFNNYAGIGFPKFAVYILCNFALFFLDSLVASFILSFLLQKILKHMLENFYYRNITERSYVNNINDPNNTSDPNREIR